MAVYHPLFDGAMPNDTEKMSQPFDDEVLTQLTQLVDDPRRDGHNNSGLCDQDISDVICILHPCSQAAIRVVAETAERRPQHVLQNSQISFEGADENSSMLVDGNGESTFILPENAPTNKALDLAFRFSSRTISPHLGFVFGRNPTMADIAFTGDCNRRVSNQHFAIYFNNMGVLMIKDLSTNGTMVDENLLKGKSTTNSKSRMLLQGSVVQVLASDKDEVVKFIVRYPSRDGHWDAFDRKFQQYMKRQIDATNRFCKQRAEDDEDYEKLDEDEDNFDQQTAIKAPRNSNKFGMRWDGGDIYNVVGTIGKGAFATVYQLATKRDGNLFAAKELEKRKFMKNGVLDRKLDNEMNIMRSISHPSIVQYRDYQDIDDHLYIIMEYVPYGDLQQFLAEHGALPESIAKQVAAQTFDALDYLHKKGVTHRDIKPDNILLSRVQPNNFIIKLSDFGLSKAVNSNDTFLKTFCGTLLYCAPEVFPHYEPNLAGHGIKRPREARTSKKFRSYSHAVDIWSFGAVLWFSLCHKPPFEGIADATGKAMFERIMMTPLDPSELAKQGTSDAAVALLMEMLNTDPLARPSAEECLANEWLQDQPSPATYRQQTQLELEDIAEEDDVIEGAQDPDVAALTLDEPPTEEPRPVKEMEYVDEVSFNSNDANFFDPRKSKRFKTNDMDDRDEGEPIDSSLELIDEFGESIPIMHEDQDIPQDYSTLGSAPSKPPKLFGEISQSDLQHIAAAGVPVHQPAVVEIISAARIEGRDTGGTPAAGPAQAGRPAPLAQPAETTQSDVRSSTGSYGVVEMLPAQNDNIPVGLNADDLRALRDSAFNRRIQIGVPPSFGPDVSIGSNEWVDTAGSSVSERSQNAENLPTQSAPASNTSRGAPDSESGSIENGDSEIPNIDILTQSNGLLHSTPEGGPRFGRLVSTPESFARITINLNERMTSFGRRSRNTHTYEDQAETRISKDCFTVFFHATGIENVPLGKEDFDVLPGSYCGIFTGSSNGIKINKARLGKVNSEGQHTFGKLYSGDIVEVWPHSKNQKGLEFVVEIYQGGTKAVRPGAGSLRFKPEKGVIRELRQSRTGVMLPPPQTPKQQQPVKKLAGTGVGRNVPRASTQ